MTFLTTLLTDVRPGGGPVADLEFRDGIIAAVRPAGSRIGDTVTAAVMDRAGGRATVHPGRVVAHDGELR